MRNQAGSVLSPYLRAQAAHLSGGLGKESALSLLAMNEVYLLYLFARWADAVPLDVSVDKAHRKGEVFVGHSYKQARRAMEAMKPWKGGK